MLGITKVWIGVMRKNTKRTTGAKGNNFVRVMTSYYNIYQVKEEAILAIFSYLWLFFGTSGYLWHSLAVFGYLYHWLFWSIFGYLCLFQAILAYHKSFK